jgi:MOSC domain-containing protein YiiM
MVKTFRGPNGLTLTLDSSEIFPRDPGAGTPAMLTKGRASGTFYCVLDTGEMSTGDVVVQLSATQQRWLESKENMVDEFISAYTHDELISAHTRAAFA